MRYRGIAAVEQCAWVVLAGAVVGGLALSGQRVRGDGSQPVGEHAAGTTEEQDQGPAVGRSAAPLDLVKPHQTISLAMPPESPDQFNPDPGLPPVPYRLFMDDELRLQLGAVTTGSPAALAPPGFNPDPGGISAPMTPGPLIRNDFDLLPAYQSGAVPEDLRLPREPVRQYGVEPMPPLTDQPYHMEPLPLDQKLPRAETRSNQWIEHDFNNPSYPLRQPGDGGGTNYLARPDRWRVGFVPWKRYTSDIAETPYQTATPYLWHPYRQSLLKGDLPVIGQDIFLNLTASSETEFEGRRIPTGAGISGARPDNAEFFGQSEQFLIQNNLAVTVDLFKGEAAFKPVKWAIHLMPVYNLNYTYTRETGVISPDPRGYNTGNNAPPPPNGWVTNPGDVGGLLNGQVTPFTENKVGSAATTRTADLFALQEAFAEMHITDLSDNYDFIAVRAGNQVFNSDFRGFVFNDVNTAVRLFGNADNNRLQYNLAGFDMREKDTFSDLNTFDERNQRVLVANVYRQDFLWKGYTAQLSFHADFDNSDTHYDRAGNIVRPAPIGTVRAHDVSAYYVGWAGDGHIGRLNVSHAFYEVLGRDDFNGLAGHAVDIDAQMGALELSYDRDWIRYKASFFYASGDGNAKDNTATGFDTILDNPNFTGGPFSYYVRQGFNLAGTAVNLKQRGSLVPDLRTSKTEGQANFVNPGIFIYSLGTELDVTPKLRSLFNFNYLRFAETDAIKTALLTDKIHRELGWDLSMGFQYRPFLTDNVIISAGFGALLPGQGYKDIYRHTTDPVPGYTSASKAGTVDDFLFSGLIAITLTF